MVLFDAKVKDEYLFNLTSTANDKYPYYQSQNYIQGRKCFEFSWKNGTQTFIVGFANGREQAYIYGNNGDIEYRVIRENESNLVGNIDKIEEDVRYMVCIDTMKHSFLVVNKTYIRSFSYPSFFPNKMRILFQCGSHPKWDFVNGWFRTPFNNQMPASFVQVISNVLYEHPSCHYCKKSCYFLFVFIIFYLS